MVGLWLLFKVTSLGPFFCEIQELDFQYKVLQHKYRPSPLCSSLCCLIPLGFPNVTMAPNCDLESSQGPIVQKSHPPSQLSILSESVMDSQVTYVLFMHVLWVFCLHKIRIFKDNSFQAELNRFLLITFIEDKVN